jgi:hypothetical protein
VVRPHKTHAERYCRALETGWILGDPEVGDLIAAYEEILQECGDVAELLSTSSSRELTITIVDRIFEDAC